MGHNISHDFSHSINDYARSIDVDVVRDMVDEHMPPSSRPCRHMVTQQSMDCADARALVGRQSHCLQFAGIGLSRFGEHDEWAVAEGCGACGAGKCGFDGFDITAGHDAGAAGCGMSRTSPVHAKVAPTRGIAGGGTIDRPTAFSYWANWSGCEASTITSPATSFG